MNNQSAKSERETLPNQEVSTSGSPPCYLAFSDSSWMQIPLDWIERIEYPPIEMPWDQEPFAVLVPRAICVVTVDGREVWSQGDRSWRERERQRRLDAAHYKWLEAERECRETVAR